SRPRIIAQTASRITAKVVSLIPPAVELGAPPTNMSRISKNCVGGYREAAAKVRKPDVREAAIWNNPASTFSGRERDPMVRGFLHSINQNSVVPARTTIPVTANTSLEWRLRRRV